MRHEKEDLNTRVCFNHRFASTEKAELAEQLVDVVSLPPASNGAVAATNGIQNENTISVLLNFEVEEVRNLPELSRTHFSSVSREHQSVETLESLKDHSVSEEIQNFAFIVAPTCWRSAVI